MQVINGEIALHRCPSCGIFTSEYLKCLLCSHPYGWEHKDFKRIAELIPYRGFMGRELKKAERK